MPASTATSSRRDFVEALYKTYGKTSDEEIRELLKRIQFVEKTHKGIGSRHGYYTMDDKTMARIVETPRNVSHTFDFKPNKLVKGLREFKRIPVLVKSSSRFFLKPDVGEVFDAMSDEDKKRTKAIETLTDDSETLPSAGLDEFLIIAVLLE